MNKLRSKEFVITGELETGRTGDLTTIIDEAEALKPYVTAVNIPDNPGSFVAMSGLAAGTYLHLKSGLDIIYQQTGRDANRLGIASMLLGANAVGIKNILVLTGDHPTLGDIPQAKPVFDLDSTQILQLAREMVDQQKIYGKPIENSDIHPVQFHIGISANPNSTHPEVELLKIQRKVEIGAEFIQTQVIFDLDKNENFFQGLKKLKIPILIGLCPMKDYVEARDFNQNVHGVQVPLKILDDFKAISQSNKDKKDKNIAYDKLNCEIITPLIQELRKKGYPSGIHITARHYPKIYPQLFPR